MTRPRTENNARFACEYPKEKIFDLLGNSPVTTNQVRNLAGGCSVGTAKNKLEELFKEGKITRIRSGNIWIWQKVI